MEPNNDLQIFARNMRVRRMQQRLTQDQLARKARLSLSAVSRIETATAFPRDATAQAIATALKVEPGQLFGDSDVGGGRLIESYSGLGFSEWSKFLKSKMPLCS